MRYGLFLSQAADDASGLQMSSAPFSDCEPMPKTRGQLPFDRAIDPAAVIASPLFGRKRRAATTADNGPVAITKLHIPSQQHPRSARSSTYKWQLYGRRSLGVPFPLPVASPSATAAGDASGPATASAYARGDRYRELAEKARGRLRRVSADAAASVRSHACLSYAQPIQRELEETQRFLSQLSLGPPLATGDPASKPLSSKPAAIDSNVADTLNRIKDLRREYEEKRKAEADAQTKLRQDRELEKQQRQQMKKKAEEDKAKALAEASASVASPAPATPKRVPEKPTAKTPAAVKSSTTAPAAAAAATVKKSTAAPAAAPPATIKIEEMPSPPSPTPVSASSSRLVSQDALEWATKYRTLYARLMSEFAPQIQNDRDKRAYCSKHRGTLVRTFGQLKDSWVFVNRCIDTVSDILAESTRHGDAVHSWMLNLTAKAIVKQAEKEVSIAQHAAYPLATATVLLMQRFPQLVDLLLVRLVKKCPYVVPQYMAKRPGQSVEDYLRGIGYKMKSDDELESESIYNERMTGMLALYAAIIQIASASGKPNPLPVSHGWTWMARMANLPPQSISPLLVHTFLLVAGTSLTAAYGKQMKKLLDVLAGNWIPAITAKDPTATASKSNLSGYLEKYQLTGTLPECEGRVIKYN